MIQIDQKQFANMIEKIIFDSFQKMEHAKISLGSRLSFTESEAAALLGVGRHALRDARLRGEVEASKVGRRILYSRDQLLQLLQKNRIR